LVESIFRDREEDDRNLDLQGPEGRRTVKRSMILAIGWDPKELNRHPQ
jgi:hypothetical protein